MLLWVSFFESRKDSPSEESSSPKVLEFGIWNLGCGSAALWSPCLSLCATEDTGSFVLAAAIGPR
jgi:hypothetical protein